MIIIIWLILGFVISLIIFCIMLWSECDGFFEYIGMVFLSSFVSAFIGLLSALIVGSIIGASAPTKDVLAETKEIYALKDNSAISGSFFLGCGGIDENMKYYYISENKYGRKMESMAVDNCYLKYDSKPRIERYEKQFANKKYDWIAINLNTSIYVIYVPEGSIINEYSVDLE